MTRATNKPVRPALVEGLIFTLLAHPDMPPRRVQGVLARLSAKGDDCLLEFTVSGAESLATPILAAPTRQDGLWQSTCFELFVRSRKSDSYFEFNFSPSMQWAAYAFESYRNGMRNHDLESEPQITVHRSDGEFVLKASFTLADLPVGPLELAISAVIEETDGTKSYWALAHPSGQPDFHHPACFVATLPAPQAP